MNTKLPPLYPTIQAGKDALLLLLRDRQPQTCEQIRKLTTCPQDRLFAQGTELNHFLSLMVRHKQLFAVCRPNCKRRKLYSVVPPDGQLFLAYQSPAKAPPKEAPAQPTPTQAALPVPLTPAQENQLRTALEKLTKANDLRKQLEQAKQEKASYGYHLEDLEAKLREAKVCYDAATAAVASLEAQVVALMGVAS